MLIDFLKVRVMRQMPRDNDFLMEESNGTRTGYFIRNYVIGKILLGIFNFKHDTAADPADCLPVCDKLIYGKADHNHRPQKDKNGKPLWRPYIIVRFLMPEVQRMR